MTDQRAQRPASQHSDSREMHFTHLITVFAVSTGLVGVCLTAMSIVQLLVHTAKLQTSCDELLLVVSAALLIAAVSSFISMRMRFRGPWRSFALIADICLLLGVVAIAGGAMLLAFDFNAQF